MRDAAEVLVVGGGAAGAALACGLGARGRRALLVERARGPHDKVCGEFLSGEAAAALRALGLDPAALGARPLHRLRFVEGAEAAEAALPFPAWGLSRRHLDAALLERARALGAEVRPGVGARRLEDGAATLDDGSAARAAAVALATGKHELRGRARRPGERGRGGKIGLKTHLRLAPAARRAVGEAVEVHLFPGGYVGLQPIEDDRANLCLAVEAERFAAAGGSLPDLLRAIAPRGTLLAARLDGAEPLSARPLAVARIPYGYRCWRESEDPDWLWRVGDQAAVTPSFTGDGLAIALRSAALAAEALDAGAETAAYRRRLRREVGGQMRRALALDRLLASRAGRRAALRAGRAAPALLRLAAAATRLPEARPEAGR